MVELVFDATKVEAALPERLTTPPITITLGRSKREMRWTDRRTLTMPELAGMLCQTSIGPKDGACFTPATFRGTARRKDEAEEIGLAVLDSDCGHTLDEIAANVRQMGWEAIIHSTFSHMTTTMAAATSAVDKWRAQNGDDIPRFMREKHGFLPHIVANARIIDEQKPNYIIEHAPCPKYRVVVPLVRPWRAGDFQAQSEADGRWANRFEAIAYALRLFIDESTKDTSRLFYFPRRLTDATPFESVHIQGEPCDIWSLPDATPLGQDANLFAAAPARTQKAALAPREVATGDITFRDEETGAQINLTHWAVGHAEKLEIIALLRARAPQKFGARRTGVKHHVVCPFDDEHTTAGDMGGCYVINASELYAAGLPTLHSGFYVDCKHNACARRDRLDYVKRMLELRWFSVEDLTNPMFLIQGPEDLTQVDISRLLENYEAKAAEKAGKVPEAIPVELTSNLPGIMGSMIKYILESAPKPQPVLALGATIAAMSCALGRKVELAGWGVRPNVYICGIGYSGSGKERPITAVKEIITRAGLYEKLVGAEDIASDVGIVAEAKQPGKESHVMLIDEIGILLNAATNKNAGPSMINVERVLLSLFTNVKGMFKSKSYGDSSKNFVIAHPSISLFGTSTPDKLFSALTTDTIKGGLLSRMMVFQIAEKDNDIPGRMPGKPDTPTDAVEWFKAWYARPAMEGLHYQGGQAVPNPILVDMSSDAQRISQSFLEECERLKRSMREEELDGLWVRAHENSLKLALIRSAALGGPDHTPMVDHQCMLWACQVVRIVTWRMVNIARDHITDTVFQARLSSFRRVIKRAGARGATMKEIMRHKACELPQREFDAVTQYLVNAGEVVFTNTNAGKMSAAGHPVKSREAFVWIADLDENTADGEDA